MITMAGCMSASRYGVRPMSEGLHFIHTLEVERVSLDLVWPFETLKPTPVTHLLQQGYTS